MVEDGIPNEDIAPYIKMAHALEDESEYESEYSADSESTSEWDIQVGENIVQNPIEPEPTPPLELSNQLPLSLPISHIATPHIRKVDTLLATFEEKQWLDDTQHHALHCM